jgi:hypothetical protein
MTPSFLLVGFMVCLALALVVAPSATLNTQPLNGRRVTGSFVV